MKLEEYLESLKNCPDEKLTTELGIYDNWPIFMKTNYYFLIKHLIKSGNYIQTKKMDNKSLFDYIPGTILMQVSSHNNFSYPKDNTSESNIYNTTILLHPYQEKKLENVLWLRTLAIVVDDISQFIIRENIPACMPYTIGWDYLDKKDDLTIVYHKPNLSLISKN